MGVDSFIVSFAGVGVLDEQLRLPPFFSRFKGRP